MLQVRPATDQYAWDAFLAVQRYRPFLQSWTMGDVYADVGQQPIRLALHDADRVAGICSCIVVPARRGRHLALSYGPILATDISQQEAINAFLLAIRNAAEEQNCAFVRMSPFWHLNDPQPSIAGARPSPLHLLAEHLWYIPLVDPDPWHDLSINPRRRTEEDILKEMRKTTRNLIGRAGRDGVTIRASQDPIKDLELFLRLHEETRRRHGFTPYTNAFFRAQVSRFAPRNECTLYLAHYQNEVIASSIHLHVAGETSYHHGASTHAHAKIPASYLLQWTAIQDAIRRGDHVYNFWGIAPEGMTKHPFAGVTTFKTGFGGSLLPLAHCMDVPLTNRYHAVRLLEQLRKWRRGF